MNRVMKVHSEVPFGHQLFVSLYLKDLHLNAVVKHDRMEMHYLAWETVRKQTNPFFQKGTGFEGYLVGHCSDAEAALEEILQINQDILDAIARMYRFEYGFRSRLMKTLVKEANDSEAIQIWSAYFGAELGKLRARILSDNEAQAFRLDTYRIVSTLPTMKYDAVDDDIFQNYAIGTDSEIEYGKLAISIGMLPAHQQDAWLVADNIGEFGHPLIRHLLLHDPDGC